MKKSKSKSMLDEMQEQKLLQIEHRCCWLGFFALFIAIYGQQAMGHGSMREVAGEAAVLILMSIYLLVACIRNGIWDRKLRPDLKTNLLLSLGTGAVVGLFWFVVSYTRYHQLVGSIATFFSMMICVTLLVLAALSATSAIYKRRKRKLDQQADRDEKE